MNCDPKCDCFGLNSLTNSLNLKSSFAYRVDIANRDSQLIEIVEYKIDLVLAN